MSDIIKLLPDSIANQIAAGEVIQRPSSVLKELLENSLDAGSSEINIIIKGSGKTMIQIIDNGKGMSETDARMCFERHATSKIRKTEDLFKISSMGFRGEAMASIASIAHVELITKTPGRELGTKIFIKGSKVQSQEVCSAPQGTSIKVSNLFFNVPARRKFLKSDPTELKHLVDEFVRIALAHPDIHFSFHHEENELYHLVKSNLRQRIISVFGKSYNEKLVPVHEASDWIVIDGFVGKAEYTKRTKGEQFLFVNQRFIKSNYINHAIRAAYEELVAKDYYPLYVLSIKIDPSKIDVNVHPTKQEIKFEEERLIYNFMKVAVRHAIGKYTLTPVIDFNESADLSHLESHRPTTRSSIPSGFNKPFDPNQQRDKDNRAEWQSIYEGLQSNETEEEVAITIESKISNDLKIEEKSSSYKKPLQLQRSYILTQIKSGLMILDQQAAHERILFESHLKSIKEGNVFPQTLLFTETIELSPSNSKILESLLDKLKLLGLEIDLFGNNTFVVRSLPVGFKSEKGIKQDIELLLEKYQENLEFSNVVEEGIAKSVALKSAIKRGVNLEDEEMQDLIDQLFACESPYFSPSGRKCFITLDLDDINKRFSKE